MLQVYTTDQRQISEDSVTTLARMSFSLFKPLDLKCDMSNAWGRTVRDNETGLPGMYRGPFEGDEHGYIVFTHFK